MDGPEEGEASDLSVAGLRSQLDEIRVSCYHAAQLAIQRRTPELTAIGERRADLIQALHTTIIAIIAPIQTSACRPWLRQSGRHDGEAGVGVVGERGDRGEDLRITVEVHAVGAGPAEQAE